MSYQQRPSPGRALRRGTIRALRLGAGGVGTEIITDGQLCSDLDHAPVRGRPGILRVMLTGGRPPLSTGFQDVVRVGLGAVQCGPYRFGA